MATGKRAAEGTRKETDLKSSNHLSARLKIWRKQSLFEPGTEAKVAAIAIVL